MKIGKSTQKLEHNNLSHVKFQLFDLAVTDLIKIAENVSDKAVKFAKMFDW